MCTTKRPPRRTRRPFLVVEEGISMQASFTLWQTWQRPTLPRLETEYHRRWGVSRPSSEWDRVQPPRNNHQVGKRVRQTGLSISTGDSHAHQANAALVGPRPVPGHVENMLRMSGPARAPPSRSGPRISARNSRVRELMSIALMRANKPIELLVPVSSTPCGASTPGLSTWSSSTALEGVLVSRWVSRLDAFSGYPVRT